MSILGNRIKKERENLDLTREDLAQKLGVSYSAIAMYEQGNREPNNELILKMCKLFNCSVDYLMGETDFKNFDNAFNDYMKTQRNIDVNNAIQYAIVDLIHYKLPIEQIEKILTTSPNNDILIKDLKKIVNNQPAENRKNVKNTINKIINYLNDCSDDRNLYHSFMYLKEKKNERFYMCPVYGQISAGQPNWAEECIEGRLPIDPSLMDIVDPEECFFLRVNGESMNKVVRNGSYALIRKTDWVENGEIAVVLVNGFDATLKKFSKQGDLVVLEPMSNDNSFQVQIYDKNTPIKILGKYIGKFEMNK